MRFGRHAAAALLLLALAGPSLARGAFPAPRSHLIVPGTSIGGVTRGQTIAQAKRRWGRPSSCTTSHYRGAAQTGCVYGINLETSTQAGFESRRGRIVAVYVSTSCPSRHIPRRLARFKTASGIRLGSTPAQVRKAYPQALRVHSVISLGDSSSQTSFDIIRGIVCEIEVGRI